MILQSKLTENIARDEMYSISKKMLTVKRSSLIGLHKQMQVGVKNSTKHHISVKEANEHPVNNTAYQMYGKLFVLKLCATKRHKAVDTTTTTVRSQKKIL